jgi:hypothetical protein
MGIPRTSPFRRVALALALASALAVWPLGGLLTERALASSAGVTVVAWGDNLRGERDIPVDLSDARAISVGPWRSALALKADGTVVAWGEDDNGDTRVPPRLSGVVAISAGPNYSLALEGNGTVVGWGNAAVPAGLSGVMAISAGPNYSLALERDGTVVAWGAADRRASPSGIVAVSAGGEGLGLRSDGTVVALVGPVSDVPAGLTEVVAISAGGHHSLALRRDGTVVAWGDNSHGQTRVPSGLSDVIAISAGNDFSLALKRNGTVLGWGNNQDGQINVPDGLSGVTAISAGGFSLALVGSGGSAGKTFPLSIIVAAAIPLGFVALGALVWYRRPNFPEIAFGRIPRQVLPTGLALLFALLSLPLVALSFGATDSSGNWAPATALGQWSAAAGAVTLAALVAGTIGAPLVRRNAGGGAAITFVLALLVAIPASPLLPWILGQNVGIGRVCLDTCGSVTSTNNLGNSLRADLYFLLAPIVEPVPVATLALGVGLWTAAVRRLPAR